MPDWVWYSSILVLVMLGGAVWKFATRTIGRTVDTAANDRITSSRAILGGPGLTFHVESDPSNLSLYDFFGTSVYLLPQGALVDDVPQDDVDAWWGWASSLGGDPVESVRIVITIQLLVDRAVAVDEPRIEKTPIPDPDGQIVRSVPMGGAGFWPAIYKFDLDANSRRPKVIAESAEYRPSGFRM